MTLVEMVLTSNVTTNLLVAVIILTNYSMRHNVERALEEQGLSYQKLVPVKWFPKRVAQSEAKA